MKTINFSILFLLIAIASLNAADTKQPAQSNSALEEFNQLLDSCDHMQELIERIGKGDATALQEAIALRMEDAILEAFCNNTMTYNNLIQFICNSDDATLAQVIEFFQRGQELEASAPPAVHIIVWVLAESNKRFHTLPNDFCDAICSRMLDIAPTQNSNFYAIGDHSLRDSLKKPFLLALEDSSSSTSKKLKHFINTCDQTIFLQMVDEKDCGATLPFVYHVLSYILHSRSDDKLNPFYSLLGKRIIKIVLTHSSDPLRITSCLSTRLLISRCIENQTCEDFRQLVETLESLQAQGVITKRPTLNYLEHNAKASNIDIDFIIGELLTVPLLDIDNRMHVLFKLTIFSKAALRWILLSYHRYLVSALLHFLHKHRNHDEFKLLARFALQLVYGTRDLSSPAEQLLLEHGFDPEIWQLTDEDVAECTDISQFNLCSLYYYFLKKKAADPTYENPAIRKQLTIAYYQKNIDSLPTMGKLPDGYNEAMIGIVPYLHGFVYAIALLNEITGKPELLCQGVPKGTWMLALLHYILMHASFPKPLLVDLLKALSSLPNHHIPRENKKDFEKVVELLSSLVKTPPPHSRL